MSSFNLFLFLELTRRIPENVFLGYDVATVLATMIENERVFLGKLNFLEEMKMKLSIATGAVGSSGGAIKLVKLPIVDLDDQKEAKKFKPENSNSRDAMVSFI